MAALGLEHQSVDQVANDASRRPNSIGPRPLIKRLFTVTRRGTVLDSENRRLDA